MKCPLQSEETLDLLLDRSAGRLGKVRSAVLDRHIEGCPACADWLAGQSAVWAALDSWEPEPVSMGFNRELWRKIEAADAEPYTLRGAWRRMADSIRFGAWKPVFPLAAAAMVITAGFLFDHQASRVPPVSRNGSVAVSVAGVSVSDAEQVEKTLDDIQLLRQFDAASGAPAGASSAM